MRCSKCHRYLGIIQKFCPKCGTPVTAKQKKKGLITFGIWVLLFLIFIPVLYYFLYNKPQLQVYSNFYIFCIIAFISLVCVEIIAVVYWMIASTIRFVIRQPVLGSIIIGTVIILLGFGSYFYMLDVHNKKLSDSLILIQDNLAEATVAKIMGDSLVENKKLITASWERINIEAQMVSERLKDIQVTDELVDYKKTAIVWADKISVGAKDHNLWKDVGDDPGAFKLALGDKQAQKLFKESNDKIAELKEFGDTSIKTQNTVSMLYIGAKIIVQRHWLNGMIYSTRIGLLSFNLIPRAFAAFEDVPDVGEGMDVTCQACNSPTVQMTPEQRRQYGCDTRCKPSPQQNAPQQNAPQQNAPQQNAPQQNQRNKTGNEANNNPTNVWDINGNQRAPRKVCIGRGGTSTGSSPTNVYCVEDVIQGTTGIDASAIGFAEGNPNAKNECNN